MAGFKQYKIQTYLSNLKNKTNIEDCCILYITNKKYLSYTEISLHSLREFTDMDIYCVLNKCEPTTFNKNDKIHYLEENFKMDFKYHSYYSFEEIYLRVKYLQKLHEKYRYVILVDSDTVIVKNPFETFKNILKTNKNNKPILIGSKYLNISNYPYKKEKPRFCANFMLLERNNISDEIFLEKYILNGLLEEIYFADIYENCVGIPQNMNCTVSFERKIDEICIIHYPMSAKPFDMPKHLNPHFSYNYQNFYFEYAEYINYQFQEKDKYNKCKMFWNKLMELKNSES